MSITMDSKAPPRIPHFVRLPKAMFTKNRLKLNIFGLINIGLNSFNYVPYLDWWSHDANLTISFLWDHLSKVLRSGHSTHTLYLNADNCARENKNKWMFSFLCLLVHKEIFKIIEYHFLPPGHSHEKAYFTPCFS